MCVCMRCFKLVVWLLFVFSDIFLYFLYVYFMVISILGGSFDSSSCMFVRLSYLSLRIVCLTLIVFLNGNFFC